MLSLLRRFWNDMVTTEGGLALLWMDGLLLVPMVMAAFFYPVEVLIGAAVALVMTFAGYEGYVVWRRRHPRHT